MIIISKYLVRKGFAAMAIFPFIIFKKKEFINPNRLNHEKIHLRQQLELFVLPFFIWYAIEFLYKYLKFKSSKKAYYDICFEVEAYSNENNLDYLKKRRFWNFLKYK
jgi:hypothetical protein